MCGGGQETKMGVVGNDRKGDAPRVGGRSNHPCGTIIIDGWQTSGAPEQRSMELPQPWAETTTPWQQRVPQNKRDMYLRHTGFDGWPSDAFGVMM